MHAKHSTEIRDESRHGIENTSALCEILQLINTSAHFMAHVLAILCRVDLVRESLDTLRGC